MRKDFNGITFKDFEVWTLLKSWLTLVYRIDVYDEINVQVEKFLENIKNAGQNKAVH